MKAVKILSIVFALMLSVAFISCSGGGYSFDDCVEKTVEAAKTATGGNIPDVALPAIKTGAEAACKICKEDSGGDLCKALVEGLSK